MTKCDLKEAVGFDTEYFKKGLRAISEAPLYEISLKNGQPKEGIKELAEFLRKKYENM